MSPTVVLARSPTLAMTWPPRGELVDCAETPRAWFTGRSQAATPRFRRAFPARTVPMRYEFGGRARHGKVPPGTTWGAATRPAPGLRRAEPTRDQQVARRPQDGAAGRHLGRHADPKVIAKYLHTSRSHDCALASRLIEMAGRRQHGEGTPASSTTDTPGQLRTSRRRHRTRARTARRRARLRQRVRVDGHRPRDSTHALRRPTGSRGARHARRTTRSSGT